MRFGPLDDAKLTTWVIMAVVIALIILIVVAAAEPVRLIPLHNVDGRDIFVNPANVTSLYEARAADDPKKSFTKEVACMIGLSDGRFVTVSEDCDTARSLIEGTRP